MAAAILLTGADRGETARRLRAFGRWTDKTINDVLWRCGPPTPQRALKKATAEQRSVYRKIRSGGVSAGAALRELGL